MCTFQILQICYSEFSLVPGEEKGAEKEAAPAEEVRACHRIAGLANAQHWLGMVMVTTELLMGDNAE